jgi:hypothetical protein
MKKRRDGDDARWTRKASSLREDQTLAAATLQAIGRRKMSMSEAAREIGMPPSTLINWMYDTINFGPKRQARVQAWIDRGDPYRE